MILKSIRIKLLIPILAVICLAGRADQELVHLKDLGIIEKITANILSSDHFAKLPLDVKVSSDLFDEYFKTLDPNKIYFSAGDIKEFEPQRDKLCDQLKDGDVVFAFKVFARLLQRSEEYSSFSIDLIKKGLDFTKDDEFTPDRSKFPWAKDNEELRKLWKLKTKNDVLYYRLVARANMEEQGKKKTEKIEKNGILTEGDKSKSDAKIEPSPGQTKKTGGEDEGKFKWIELSPEQKVLKRIDNNLTILKGNGELDIIEFYLTSLAGVYDPHSSYMSPKTVEDFNINMSLSLVGIGATLSLVDGYTKIMSLVPGGPADQEKHLEPNDRIIAVAQGNGEPVDIIDMPLTKVVRLIRGEENTKVRLTVLKASKGLNSVPEIIEIIRNNVLLKQSEAHGEIKEKQTENGVKKIGVIYLPSFYCDFEAFRRGDENCKSTTTDIRKIIADFKEKKVDAIVLDLRSNGGGSLYEAVALTGLFIYSGPIVQVKNSAGGIIVQPDPDKNLVYGGPLAVMVNRFSASASEILAAAIQDYSRGVIIGDSHTHGKGTVQTVLDLKDVTTYYNLSVPPGSVKITTQKFYRINGESTQIKGVSSDVVFPSYTDTMETGEKFLDHALPWDTIPAREYPVCENIRKIIPELAKKSQERIAKSKDFELLAKDIEIYDKMKKEKTLSLNEEKRWKMYAEEKNLLEQQTSLMKMEEGDLEKVKDDKKQKDIYMDEAVNVVVDLIRMNAPAFVSEAAKPEAASQQ